MKKLKYSLAFLVCFGALQMVTACVGKPQQPRQSSLGDVLELLSTPRSFNTTVLKTQLHDGVLYSLIYQSENPTDEGRASLVAHTIEGLELLVKQLSPEYTLTDFDVLPDGRIVQLAFTSDASDLGSGVRHRELSIFIDAKKIFTLRDTREQTNPQHNDKRKLLGTDSERTVFLTNRNDYPFAQIIAGNERLFLAASGVHSTKLFSFDFSGKEIEQTELLPSAESASRVIPREFPRLSFSDGRVFVALSIDREDACAFQRNLAPTLDCSGPDFQILLQSFDDALKDRQAHLLKGSADLHLNGMVTSGKRLAVFGYSGERGSRKALVVLSDTSLSAFRFSDKDVGGESSITAAVFSDNQLLVGGKFGWEQVETGSILKPSDAFLGIVNGDGVIQVQARFGTERADYIGSINWTDGHAYVGGVVDGPITHTADTDATKGFNRWFLGRLKP